MGFERNPIMVQDTDSRGRGVLTPTDREYLRGEKEYDNPETDAHRRRDIRDRVRDSILDFELLRSELDEDERRKIFEGVTNADAELEDAIMDMFAFVCLGVCEDVIQEAETTEWKEKPHLHDMDYLVEGGLRQAFRDRDFFITDAWAETTVIGYSEQRVEVLKNVLSGRNKEFLYPEDIKILLEADEIDQGALLEFLAEHVGPSGGTSQ